MRWTSAVWAFPIVLLAQSPAFARMHVDSPPTVQSFVFIAVWIGLMTWFFSSFYGADRVALAFGVGTVASAIVLGEYADAFLHPILNVPGDAPLPLWWAVVCACLVSVITQAAAGAGAGQLTGARRRSVSEALRTPWFWIIVVVPAAYILLKTWLRT